MSEQGALPELWNAYVRICEKQRATIAEWNRLSNPQASAPALKRSERTQHDRAATKKGTPVAKRPRSYAQKAELHLSRERSSDLSPMFRSRSGNCSVSATHRSGRE